MASWLSEFFLALLRRFDVEVLDQRLEYAPLASFRGLDSLTERLRERAPA